MAQEKSIWFASGHEWFRTYYTARSSPSTDGEPWDVVCVHGLSRNGTDFDYLTNSLVNDSRFRNLQVITPDMVGRGKSDWVNFKLDYGYPLYTSSTSALIGATLRGNKLDYIGTSMGGLIGMMLAAQPNCPFRKLVLNDVGPFIPREPLVFIASYFGKTTQFDSFEAAVNYFGTIHKAFGLTPEQLVTFTKNSVKEIGNGKYQILYDPQINQTWQDDSKLTDVALWPIWDLIKCPVMVIRGQNSPLLTKETVEEMKKRGPGIAAYLEVPNVGHAPSLMDNDQAEAIKQFLLS